MIKRYLYIAACIFLVFQNPMSLSAQGLTISGDAKINLSGTVNLRLSGQSSSFNLEDKADFEDAINTSLILEGDFDNNTSFVTVLGNLIFDGSSSQSFNASAAVKSLTVSNNNALTIEGPVLVNNALNFEQSTIVTSSDDDLTLVEGATIIGSGTSGYVNGPLRVRADGTTSNVLIYPIGKGNTYHPIRLGLNQSGTTGFYVAEAFKSNIPSNTLDNALQSVSAANYWSVTSSENISNAYIELPVLGADGVSQPSLARIAKEENGTWVNLGGINLTAIPGVIRSSIAFTNLDNFIIASAKPSNDPTISSISPDRGKVGDAITITGSNLGSTPGTIKFGNITAGGSDITSWEANQIQVKVPSGLSVGSNVNLEITVDGASDPINFSFIFEVTDGSVNCSDFSITNFPKNTPQIIVGETNSFTAEVTDASLANTAEFYYRGISQEAWQGPFNTSKNGNDFSYDLEVGNTNISDVGVEYYFVFKLNGCPDVQSNIEHAYFYFTLGVNITGMSPGNTAGDYNLFSLPLNLDNKSISSTLDELGQYDKSKWRLFRVQNGSYQEFNGSNFTLEAGRGYLLIFDESTEFTSSAGSMVDVTKENPFLMSLQQGWNMIATPYPFLIQWEDVLTANGLGALTDFYYYTSTGYEAGNGQLDLFKGAIWFSENATSISVPVSEDNSGGRIAGNNKLKESFDERNWEIELVLKDDQGSKLKGGVGMKEEASLSKDYFDGMRPPASSFQSTFHFLHEEYFYPYFLKDIVPNTQNHEWPFEVAPAAESNLLSLTWDSKLVNKLDLPLYLVELNTGFVVDMSISSTYSFPASEKGDFKIVFGDNNFLANANGVIGELYPNPALDFIKLPISVPLNISSNNVIVDIYSATGKLVLSLTENNLSGGFQEIELPFQKNKISKGVYLVKVQLEIDGKVKNKSLKVLIE